MSNDSNLPASLAAVGIRDTRLITRAIRNKWPIADDKRKPLLDRQVAIALSETVSPGEATSAFRSILAANAQNLAIENRPKRRPPTITRETVIVAGDLQESKRRLWAFGQQIGVIPRDAVLTLTEAAPQADA